MNFVSYAVGGRFRVFLEVVVTLLRKVGMVD